MKKYCRLCFEDINKHQDFFHWLKQDHYLCGDCMKQMIYLNTHRNMDGMDVHILYLYNEFLENMLFQYKEGRDIALAPVFFHEVISMMMRTYKDHVICLCPSSKEKTKERGFHALHQMLEDITLPKLQPFIKSENRKQSSLHFDERQHIHEILKLDENVVIPSSKILLIDDVCTTGATLKACYNLLTSRQVKIQTLVLCANPLFVNQS